MNKPGTAANVSVLFQLFFHFPATSKISERLDLLMVSQICSIGVHSYEAQLYYEKTIL